MREFKFRALLEYAKGEWYMIYKDKLVDELTLYDLFEETEYAKIMQYTGLEDKNGVEIYEGDILKVYSGGETLQIIVKWDSRDAGFKGYSSIDSDVSYWILTFSDQCMEVIGNIYENKEVEV